MTGHCGGPYPWPSFINAGQSIDVTMFFFPSGTGARSAQLVFSTDAAGSPQTVQLQGNGTSLGLAVQLGPTLINAGQTATYQLDVFYASTLSGTITLSCTGAPVGATCTPNPASFPTNGTLNQLVNVMVTTTAHTSSALIWHRWPFESLAGAFAVVLLVPRKRRWRRALAGAGALLLITAMVSCGGSGGGGGGGGGTPSGTYTLTVTATANGASSSVPLTLTVQ